MIGYFRFSIEVERLVHHSIQVRHPVVGLHRERLGELEAHFLERAQIRRLQLRDDVAERVVEDGFRRRVDARGVGDEVAVRLRDDRRLRRVAGGEELHARAVETDPVEVRVIRVFALLAAGGGEVDHARLLVDALERGRDELAFREPVLERAGGGVIEIEVAPAVALRPEDQLRSVAGEAERFGLDVGVQPFLDDGLTSPVAVSATQTSRRCMSRLRRVKYILSDPSCSHSCGRGGVCGHAGATAASTSGAHDRALGLGGDVDGLILEALRLDLDAVS